MATPARSIVITGFMGTGKTTAARALADRLGWPLLDMDAEIERRAGRSIRAIFAEQGEPAFRQMERALVAELAAGSGMVIATGGGALVDEGSRERLLASACVVCLDAAPEVIEARLAGSSARPLAGEWRDYAGYLISFVFVGGVWVTHSTLTSYMKRGDSLTFRLNLLLLFFVSLLPFLTALMTTHLGKEGENLAAALYGVDLFIASALFTALIRYVASQSDMIADGVDRAALVEIDRKRRVLVLVLGLSVLIAIVFPNVAVALYLAVSLAFLITPLVRANRARRSRQNAGT